MPFKQKKKKEKKKTKQKEVLQCGDLKQDGKLVWPFGLWIKDQKKESGYI